MERQLVADYEARIGELVVGLAGGDRDLAVEIAALPMSIRGYGHVKLRSIEAARAREAELLARWRAAPAAARRDPEAVAA